MRFSFGYVIYHIYLSGPFVVFTLFHAKIIYA